VRVNVMVEGQEGVTWDQWRGLARTAEDAGLEGLFRSDHYQSVAQRRERSSLDAWTTLAALAALTDRIRLGTMVSPTSFRHPSVLARSAVTVDHVSGGRVELGMGAGWHELEHTTHGFPFHDVATRYDVFEEQIGIVRRQLDEGSFDHAGAHYTLSGSDPRPKPVQGRLPIVCGGAAGPRAARIAATWADEYNTIFPTVDQAGERRDRIVAACEEAGRAPLVFSIMTGCLLGEDRAELRDRAARLMERSGRDGDVDDWLEGLADTWVVGTLDEASQRLAAYAEVGVERVMLQHQLHDDLDMVRLMARLG
jgi:alkanesulfonate monooxygenase SsuD/methylene tetrahydromethanopterin reductase-like flavin-dependent oxidoreductase (luciferase family)